MIVDNRVPYQLPPPLLPSGDCTGLRGFTLNGAIHVQSWASRRLSRGMFWLRGAISNVEATVLSAGQTRFSHLRSPINRSASWSSDSCACRLSANSRSILLLPLLTFGHGSLGAELDKP